MSDANDIEAQAAKWLVRGDAGGGESDDLALWLAQDPRHRAAYLRLAAAWDRTTQLKRLVPEGTAIDADLLSPRHHSKSRLQSWSSLALAASLASLALISFWWFASRSGVETYRTDVGGLSRVVLTDGSAVTLNTDTELRVRFLPHRREITLTRGEAQFAVAHDVSRPFEVSAGGRIVRAVGTAFDVRLDSDHAVQVLVTEGRVALEDAHDETHEATTGPETISAGETAIAHADKVTVRRVSATETSRRLAWRTGELSFQGETLADAVAEFNRYNHRKLRIGDPSIAPLQIGGNFQALDVDSFVAALLHSFNVRAVTLDDGSVVLEGPGNSH